MNKPHTIMEDEVLVAWNKRSARKPQQTPKVPSYVGEVIAVTSHIQTYAQNEIEKLLATALEEQRKEILSEVYDLMNESDGVAGLHLNGEVATWDWLLDHGWLPTVAKLNQLKGEMK